MNTNLNHADVAKFPAQHPLNPNLNGQHWSWQGGFIFLALEGLWRNGAGQLDLASALNAPRPLSFAKECSLTHSRDGDPISAVLVKNLTGAFAVHRVSNLTDVEITVAHPKPLYLPAKFTPYEFKMSATFPIPDLPRDNPLTVERVELGKQIFFDKHVSINNAQSCADCHAPDKAFTDGRRTARGAEGAFGERNSMPLFNLAWKREFFWDGRAKSLRDQVLQPIQNPIEMHQSLTNLVTKFEIRN